MLATPRRLLLALVALAASTPDLIAGVICTPNGNGSWTCSGDGSGYNPDYPYQPGEVVTNTVYVPTVQTNVLGVCTNCVAMSPSECSEIKSTLISNIDEAYLLISKTQSDIDRLLPSWGDFWDQYLMPIWDEIDVVDPDGESDWYYSIGDKVDNVDYWYDDVSRHAEQWKEDLQVADGLVFNLKNTVNRINCSSCTASFGGDTPSGGGGGGGGGGSGSSSCPDCPCKEQIEALHDLLKDDFLPKVKRIDENVEKLKELVDISKKQLETTKQGFGNVTNLFNRLDDYVLDDFSNRVFQIRYDVNFIASNLAQKVQRIFIDQSYSNAQFYVRQDSDTPVEMADLDETLIPEGDVSKFDWGEFENLSWFTRVEYLLLKLNGVYVTTNNSSNAGVSEAEENQQEIEDGFSDFKSSVNGDIKTGFTQVGTSISTFFSSFNSAVSTQGDKVVEIRLMSNFIGQEPLMLNIDPDVADACRTISSLLWTVLFGFLLYKIMIYFWVVFVDTINWWVNQTQGFVK